MDNTNLNDNLHLTDNTNNTDNEINGGVPEKGTPPSPVYKTDVTPGSGFNPTFKDSSEIMYIAGIHVVREELPEMEEQDEDEEIHSIPREEEADETEKIDDVNDVNDVNDVIEELIETSVSDLPEQTDLDSDTSDDSLAAQESAISEETAPFGTAEPDNTANEGIAEEEKASNEVSDVEENESAKTNEASIAAPESEEQSANIEAKSTVESGNTEYRFAYEPNVLRRPKSQEYSPDKEANPSFISVLQIVSGVLLGIALAIVPIMFYLLSLLDEFLICAAVLLAAVYIFSDIYALGRFISARVSEGKVHLFHFSVLRFVFGEEKAEFSFALPSKVKIVATPKKEHETVDFKMIRFFSGGFALVCGIAALLLTLAIIFTVIDFGKLVLLILYPSVAAALTVAAFNFFCAFRSATPTDGNIIRALLTRSPRTVYLIRLYIASHQLYMGICPSELDVPDIKLNSLKMTSEPYVGQNDVDESEKEDKQNDIAVSEDDVIASAPYNIGKDKVTTAKLSREAEQYASEAMDAAYICEEITPKGGDFLPQKESTEKELSKGSTYTPRSFVDKGDYKSESLRPYPRYLEHAQKPSQYLLLCLFYRYLAELDRQGDDQNQYLLALQKHISRFPSQIREYLCRELCYMYSIENNPPAAYDYRRLLRADASLSFMRVQAYYAYHTLGNMHAARTICSKAKKRFEEISSDKFAPYMGMAKMEMSFIDTLDGTLNVSEQDQ